MNESPPALEALTRRLAETPPECLMPPQHKNQGRIHVDAVLFDLARALGEPRPDPLPLSAFARTAEIRLLRLALIGAWLLHHPWFRRQGRFAGPALAWLTQGLAGLAQLVEPGEFVTDPDRREELARLCLDALGLVPPGEEPAQATDRLTALSSVERQRVVDAARAAEKRAPEVREALARKAAEEAAAKTSRE